MAEDDLLQEAMTALAEGKPLPEGITAFVCHGPASTTCKCNCPEGNCEHQWDGPSVDFDNGRGSSVTCSRCGMAAIDHDMWVF